MEIHGKSWCFQRLTSVFAQAARNSRVQLQPRAATSQWYVVVGTAAVSLGTAAVSLGTATVSLEIRVPDDPARERDGRVLEEAQDIRQQHCTIGGKKWWKLYWKWWNLHWKWWILHLAVRAARAPARAGTARWSRSRACSPRTAPRAGSGTSAGSAARPAGRWPAARRRTPWWSCRRWYPRHPRAAGGARSPCVWAGRSRGTVRGWAAAPCPPGTGCCRRRSLWCAELCPVQCSGRASTGALRERRPNVQATGAVTTPWSGNTHNTGPNLGSARAPLE